MLIDLVITISNLFETLSVTFWNAVFNIYQKFYNISKKEIRTVDKIDLNKYTGVWYQVCHLPNNFQNTSAINTTATYNLCSDGTVEVVNKEIVIDSKTKESKVNTVVGGAIVVGAGKLLVTFFNTLFGGFYAPYWVVELGPVVDEKYSYSVVTDPTRSYLWILARASLDSDTVNGILHRLKTVHGFDNLNKLVYTQQSYSTERYQFTQYENEIRFIKDLYETSGIKRFTTDRFSKISKSVRFVDFLADTLGKKIFVTNFNSLRWLGVHIHLHIDESNLFVSDTGFTIKPQITYKTLFGLTIKTDSFITARIDKDGTITYLDEGWYNVYIFGFFRKIVRFVFSLIFLN
ncbi:hypothetical protein YASMINEVIRUS_393 [Yasminevirus sp. GU-2018]|uniref:Lipocalin/cytosolic fatty-acid binding domain-containing protein n=1 Tax=Yasminevirus sp. GU-2018 TaxID=2420051 RepID=A0A5K0U804_9VIRU|nr:hypothetical protein YASMINEVIRUS_393 [Yasminevirus sp. GU-2018]